MISIIIYNRKSAGFTLIEIIVVVVLLGVLTSLAGLHYFNLKEETTADLVTSDLQVIKTAIVMYQVHHRIYPPDLGTLVQAGYLAELTNDKFGKEEPYLYLAQPTSSKLWSRGPNGQNNNAGADDIVIIIK